ncbi:hypothetical protein [Actinomadura nitritigenes]|uniref:hypothetical protein n=1 Tax=Actinomadura nitritigenes TaxID=134602 RepID=UPI003D9159D6
MRQRLVLSLLATAALAAATALAAPANAAQSPEVVDGVLDDGTAYRLTQPAHTNGTLLLTTDLTLGTGLQDWALDQGFAVTGNQLSQNWRLDEDIANARKTLTAYEHRFGRPSTVIMLGRSQGGLVTRGAAEALPGLLDGALPMCGGGAGSIGMWNDKLDAEFALKTLVDPASPLKIVRIGTDGVTAETAAAEALLDKSIQTPAGRARLALAAALMQEPDWNDPSQAEPAPTDYGTLVGNWRAGMSFGFGGFVRAGYEQTAGGNVSWNVGVDYGRQLERSGRLSTVKAIYRQAGISLDKDLRTLHKAPRISPTPRR